jgi:hypothetical protein
MALLVWKLGFICDEPRAAAIDAAGAAPMPAIVAAWLKEDDDEDEEEPGTGRCNCLLSRSICPCTAARSDEGSCTPVGGAEPMGANPLRPKPLLLLMLVLPLRPRAGHTMVELLRAVDDAPDAEEEEEGAAPVAAKNVAVLCCCMDRLSALAACAAAALADCCGSAVPDAAIPGA